MINLGTKVKDKVSGYEGIAICRSVFLNGCIRITVQAPVDKEGKIPADAWFDEQQLEIVDAKSIMMKPKKQLTGGPQTTAVPSGLKG